MVKRAAIVALTALLMMGCDVLDLKGLFVPTGDVVADRYEQSMQMTGGEPLATISADADYSVYLCTDSHISDSYDNLREFVTQMRNDDEAPFGVVLGDCIGKRGVMSSYVEAIERVADSQPRNTPIFTVLGNHDIYFSGWDDFAAMVGPSVYWFEVCHNSGSDLFVTLDTASGTLGGDQMRWLEELLATRRDNYRHCVVLTHVNLFNTDGSQRSSGNMTMEETHHLLDLFSRHRVTICFQGHDHHREDLAFGGVRYTIIGTIKDPAPAPEYLIVRLSDLGVEYSWQEM